MEKKELGNLSAAFKSKRKIFLKQKQNHHHNNKYIQPNRTSQHFFQIRKWNMPWRGVGGWAEGKEHFFPCKIFPPGMRNDTNRYLQQVIMLQYALPATHWDGQRATSDEEKALICAATALAETLQDPKLASRAVTSHSCRLPPVFVRGKAGTLGLQPFLSISRALPVLFAAGRDGQLHSSSCNPVLAQRGLETLPLQGEELLSP